MTYCKTIVEDYENFREALRRSGTPYAYTKLVPGIENASSKVLGYRVHIDEILLAPIEHKENLLRKQIIRYFLFDHNQKKHGQKKDSPLLDGSEKVYNTRHTLDTMDNHKRRVIRVLGNKQYLLEGPQE